MLRGMGDIQDCQAPRDEPVLPEHFSIEALGRFITRYPQSTLMDLVAERAAGLSSAQLMDKTLELPKKVDPQFLAYFAWFSVLLDSSRHSLKRATVMFDRAFSDSPSLRVSQQVHDTWLRSLYLTDRYTPDRLSPRKNQVHPETWWAVHTDALNPHLSRFQPAVDGALRPAAEQKWLQSASTPFTDGGLEPLYLSSSSGAPFDRLHSPPALSPTDGPLISVIMSVYNPTRSLVTSVNSILHQTWTNLELIIVDDASTTGLDIISEVESLDERIRLFRRNQNQGTYSGRNLALEFARGKYVTFQDADDFSHSKRLEVQASVISDGSALASFARAVRTSQDLQMTAVGYGLVPWCLPSLFFQREPVLNRLGGFDPVRRGGDSEFVERLQYVFGQEALKRIATPMVLMQMTPNSLSRGDMGTLRRHSARMSYKAASRGWRERASDWRVFPPSRPAFPAPAHISGGLQRDLKADVALLGPIDHNFTADTGPIAGALAQAGIQIGIMEFVSAEAARLRPGKRTPLDHLLAGEDPTVQLAVPGQRILTPVAVILDPASVLTMPPAAVSDVEAEELVLVIKRPISGETIRRIERQLKLVTDARVWWLPTSDISAHLIATSSPLARMLPVSQWALPSVSRSERINTQAEKLEVGVLSSRLTGDAWWIHELDNPESPLVHQHLWSFGPSPRRGGQVTRLRAAPEEWARFLDTIDILLVPHSQWISTPALDAVARGAKLLAPKSARPVYKSLALYCSPAPLMTLVTQNSGCHVDQTYLDTAASPSAILQTYSKILTRLGRDA